MQDAVKIINMVCKLWYIFGYLLHLFLTFISNSDTVKHRPTLDNNNNNDNYDNVYGAVIMT